jgi:hypothetical protein
MKLTGENWSTRRKICPSTIVSTTNPAWTDPGSNPSLAGKRPATNHLSHRTARAVSRHFVWTRKAEVDLPKQKRNQHIGATLIVPLKNKVITGDRGANKATKGDLMGKATEMDDKKRNFYLFHLWYLCNVNKCNKHQNLLYCEGMKRLC